MFKKLSQLLLPKNFKNEDVQRKALRLYVVLYASFFALLAYILASYISAQEIYFSATIKMVMGVMALLVLIRIVANHENGVRAGGILFILGLWLAFTFLALSNDGVRDSTVPLIISLIFLAAIFVDFRFAVITMLLDVVATWSIAYAETAGIIPPHTLDTPYHYARDLTLTFIVVATATYITFRETERYIKAIKEQDEKLRWQNLDLQNLRDDLELQARNLEKASQEAARHAEQMQSIAEVSSAVVSITNLDELLPSITRLISERFGYYHVGIFLLDDSGKYAVLTAANSEGGQRMLARSHRLKVEPTSIVGYATSQKTPRIALDVGETAIYFDNPDLPETHSEIALPLIVRGKVIGALDVQSTEPNAFSETDAETLTILASNVAIAIENSRLFSETQAALEEAEDIYRRFIQREWRSFRQQVEEKGYQYDGLQVQPLDHPIESPLIQQAMQKGEAVVAAEEKADETPAMAVPIQLRGETLGALYIRSKDPKRQWTQDEINLVQATAERAALALENARLVDTAQQRAGREHLVAQITTKIRSVNDPERMLQLATEELQKALGASRIQIIPYATPPNPKDAA